MTEFLNELSENQINYLKQQKKHRKEPYKC